MTLVPRVVVISRPTEYQGLLARHATAGQARFFLEQRGQSLDLLLERHHRFEAGMAQVMGAIPKPWRRARVGRDDLDRFLFEPGDVVVVVGQDGLVANTAKYLTGQTVIGLNPDPSLYDGILVTHPIPAVADLMADAVAGRALIDDRTMVEAVLDDGQRLLALNELFVGHQSHQSARYEVSWQGRVESQVSSGLIVATGTGATGWALSINRDRRQPLPLPGPTESKLAFFVREAFPSVASGVDMTAGLLAEGDDFHLASRIDWGGVIFGDGIEEDRLEFSWGRRLTIGIADSRLRLLRG